MYPFVSKLAKGIGRRWNRPTFASLPEPEFVIAGEGNSQSSMENGDNDADNDSLTNNNSLHNRFWCRNHWGMAPFWSIIE
ncbi:hypothetical protein BLOT_008907 [Blomia tropicalis]|nr:hypothetical protein BLOT_008907 [Blomia tropicalis]